MVRCSCSLILFAHSVKLEKLGRLETFYLRFCGLIDKHDGFLCNLLACKKFLIFTLSLSVIIIYVPTNLFAYYVHHSLSNRQQV